MSTTEKLAIVLLGAGTGWNMGNIGPIVTPISEEFGVSLAAVGLLSGGIVFAALLAATASAPSIMKRIGAANGARIVCGCVGVGNVILASAPVFGMALGARALVGYGAGLAFIFGPAIARTLGGVRMLGIFGASVMAGIALALVIGGVLEQIGVDWRLAILLAAVVGVLALPLLPRHVEVASPQRRETGVAMTLLRSGPLWRLTMVFMATLGVPTVVGAWLVYYLNVNGGESVATAGLLSFLIFAIATAVRVLGSRLDHRGISRGLLIGISPLLAAAGLAALAIEPTIRIAIPAAVLMGVGFSIPYAAMFDQVQHLFPERPISALSFSQMGANGGPIILVPLVGALLAGGLAELAWLMLAAIVAGGGLLNLRPARLGSAAGG